MKKALIITWEGFTDQELIYPYYRLQEEGFTVDILAQSPGTCTGICGTKIEATCSHYILTDNDITKNVHKTYDLLVIPGGVKALEKVRQYRHIIDFIKEWNNAGKVIGAICHGCQMLISAKCCSIIRERENGTEIIPRHISGYYSIEDDIINAGGIYHREPVVDYNIVSASHYKDMAEWMKLLLKVYYERNKNAK